MQIVPTMSSPGQWNVMVSSTMRDLSRERSAARSAIIAAGMRPWMAEEPPGELLGLSPERFCQRMAQECDLYVLILGPHYGFVPNEQPREGMFSITQLEYHWARNASKRKILVFIQADALTTPDRRQLAFIQEAQDFAHGYLRPQLFTSAEHLGSLVSQALSEWQRAETRGMMSYLRHSLSRLKSYHDPITNERELISATVPVHVRLHNPDDDLSRELDAPFASGPGDETLDLVTRTLEDFFDDTADIHMLRNAVVAHRRELAGGLSSLFSALNRTAGELAGASDDMVDQPRARADTKARVSPAVIDAPLQLLREFRHLFLVGDPGSGKSILVQRVACEIINQALEAIDLLNPPVPVYVTAAELNRLLKESSASAVDEFIEEVFAGIPGADLALAIAYGRGNLVLLVDGLDEVLNDHERNAIVAFLRQIGASQQVLVTMRPSIVRELRLDTWYLGSLEPLSASVRLSLVEQVLDRLAKPGQAPHDLSHLERALKERTDIRAWIGNPLLLKLVTLEYDRTGALPSSRAELYQRAFERLVDVENRQQPLVQEMTRLETETRLSQLALHMMTHGQTLVSREDIAQHASSAGLPLSEQRTAELLARASILQPRSGDQWGFIHQVFMDYAAAVELSQWPSARMCKFMVQRRLSARWEHVTRLLVGELDLRGRSQDADILIQALINADSYRISALKDRDPLHLSLLRAAQCQRDRSVPVAARGSASALQKRWRQLWRASVAGASSASAQAIAIEALGPEAIPVVRRELARRFHRHRWTIRALQRMLWFLLSMAAALLLVMAQNPDWFTAYTSQAITALARLTAPALLSVMAISFATRSLRKRRAPRASTLTTRKAMTVVSRYWPASSDIVVDLTQYLFRRARRLTRVADRVVRIVNWVTPRWIKRRDPSTWDMIEFGARYGRSAVQSLALLDDFTRWLVHQLSGANQEPPPSLAKGIRSQSMLLRPLAIYLAGLSGEMAQPMVNDIEAALQAPDEMSRLAAIAALRKIAPHSAPVQQSLARALADEAHALNLEDVEGNGVLALEPAVDGPYRVISNLIGVPKGAGDSEKSTHNRLIRALVTAVAASPSPPDQALQLFAQLLRSNDASTRTAAIIASGRVRPMPKTLVDALLAATADEDEAIARAAFEALESAHPRDPDVLQSMRLHLQDGSPMRQACALHVIGALGDTASEELPTVIALLGSEENEVRTAALRALLSQAASASPVMTNLKELLLLGEKATRLRALSTIASVAQIEITWRDIMPLVGDILRWFPDLVDELPESGRYFLSDDIGEAPGDLLSRNPASWRLVSPSGVHMPSSLRRIVTRLHQNWAGLDPAVAMLAQILSDPDADIAEAAAQALLGLGPFASAAAGTLRDLLASSSPEVTERAVTVLSLIGLDTGLSAEQLCELLSSDHARTQLSAARSLARLGEEALPALPYLKHIVMDSSDHELRVQAILAMGAMGSVAVEVLPLLTLLLHADEHDIRRASIAAIGNIGRGSQEATDILVAHIQRKKGDEVGSVLEALHGAGPTLDKHVRYLRTLLRKTSPEIRQQVLNLLSSEVSSDAQRLADYSRALGDEDVQVRRAASRALTRIRKASSGMTQEVLSLAIRVTQTPLGPMLIFLNVIIQTAKWGLLIVLLAAQCVVLFPQAWSYLAPSVAESVRSGLLTLNHQPFSLLIAWILVVVFLDAFTRFLDSIRTAGLVSTAISNLLVRPLSTRTIGLEVLSRMGPTAVSALPRIARMLNDPSQAIRDSAAASMQSILTSLDEV